MLCFAPMRPLLGRTFLVSGFLVLVFLACEYVPLFSSGSEVK